MPLPTIKVRLCNRQFQGTRFQCLNVCHVEFFFRLPFIASSSMRFHSFAVHIHFIKMTAIWRLKVDGTFSLSLFDDGHSRRT